MRLIIILIVIALVIYLVRSALSKPSTKSPARRRDGERMVSCTQCRLHIPRSEAVADGERFFCSDDHRLEWRSSRRSEEH